MTRHLLTAALPYANGPIHIGHLVEYLQADIYARFMRSIGEDLIYVCADDTHGTPIEISAIKRGITPDELVAQSHEANTRDFERFNLSFDVYYTTNSPENREQAEAVYAKLKQGGHVLRKTTSQMYSETAGRFLADRFVKGTCPKCGAHDQYGDGCEVCGTTYKPTDLIDPYDAISGGRPVERETENIYVRLADFADFLEQWVREGVPQEPVRNFIGTWLEGGLEDWCISRDAPYFGFEIPGEPNKFFYVWLDAPIGYIASTRKYCEERSRDFMADYWSVEADAEVTHVIGKDIVYFHTLFWPAMLHAAGLKTPKRVQVHGMLTLNGEKMSKSRGTLIKASTYLDHLDPEYLRFYYATKLSSGIDDFDLNLEDLSTKVNAELVNNVVNYTNRVVKFLESRFDGDPGTFDHDEALVAEIATTVEAVKAAYAEWNNRTAMRLIGELGGKVNTFFQESAPWAVFKEDPERAHAICALGLHAATALMASLIPVTPSLCARFAEAIGVDELGWSHASADWRPEKVSAPARFLERVDPDKVTAMFEQSVEEAKALAAGSRDDVIAVDGFADEITFDDFAKLDLRVGVVDSAEFVKGAKKLLEIKVNCGKPITVFAGVRSAYDDPSVLVGKRVIVVANLKPRKMRFGVSEGMLLAASGPDDEGLQLAILDDGLKGGWQVS